MNDQEDKRPYAAASNVIAVLKRARSRNLPDRIDNDFLKLCGVPDVVFSRVSNALQFLGLVEVDQSASDLLKAISAAPEEQYRDLLGGAVRTAYKADFARLDPSEDTQTTLINGFQVYQPRSQTARMVMLWLALCREAGIPVLDAPRERAQRSSSPRPRATTKVVTLGRADEVDTGRQVQTASTGAWNLGITEEDIGGLDPEQYEEVWTALGTLVRARAARARKGQKSESAVEEEVSPDDT